MKKFEYWDKGDTIFQKIWQDGIIESTLSKAKDEWPDDLISKVEEKGYYSESEDVDTSYNDAIEESENLSKNQPEIDETNAETESIDGIQDSSDSLDSNTDESSNIQDDIAQNNNVKDYENNDYAISQEELNKIEATSEYQYNNDYDAVRHPQHYNSGRYETIDKIDDFLFDKPINPTTAYAIGNVLKYLDRLGKKAPDQNKDQTQSDKNYQDLKKSVWYLLFAAMKERGLLPNDITRRIAEIINIIDR